MKQYINTLKELSVIPIEERRKYYLKRTLIETIKSFSHNNEELVFIQKENIYGFLIKPFWEDTSVISEDKNLQLLLDLEGEVSRRYVKKYPTFTLAIRKQVLEKLSIAKSLLPNHIEIIIKAGYRPVEIQRNLFIEAKELLQSRYPEKNTEQINTLTLEYVTDPDVFIPAHATGAAVDIDLFDKKENCLLDMGSPINNLDDKSWTFYTEGLSEKQQSNRQLITNAMLQAGFANLASEWWHYSYGDPRWAIFYDRKEALYDVIR